MSSNKKDVSRLASLLTLSAVAMGDLNPLGLDYNLDRKFEVKYPTGQESESKKVGSGKRARRRNRHKNKGSNNQ